MSSKKYFSVPYFLITAFLALYTFSIWLSVFSLPKEPNAFNIGADYGIHRGDIELAFYLSLILLLIFFIPFLRGLIIYWKGQEKNQAIKNNLLLLFSFWILSLLAVLISHFNTLVLIFHTPYFQMLLLQFATISIAFIFILGLYLFLFWIVDKKIWVHFAFSAIFAILLAVSFIFPFKLYMASGCENFTDTYCVGMLASSKKDVSICEKVNFTGLEKDQQKIQCGKYYVGETKDPSGCLNLSDIPKSIDSFSESDKELLSTNPALKLSPQASCIVHLVSYNNKTTRDANTCDLITNMSERNYCKKQLECWEIGGNNGEWNADLAKKYERCNSELNKILISE